MIELYAIKDIPDLRLYGFDVASNGANSTTINNNQQILSNVSLEAGQFYLVSRLNHNHNYTSSNNQGFFPGLPQTENGAGGHKFRQSNEVNIDGDDPVILYKRPDVNVNSGWKKVDEAGVNGQDGSG